MCLGSLFMALSKLKFLQILWIRARLSLVFLTSNIIARANLKIGEPTQIESKGRSMKPFTCSIVLEFTFHNLSGVGFSSNFLRISQVESIFYNIKNYCKTGIKRDERIQTLYKYKKRHRMMWQIPTLPHHSSLPFVFTIHAIKTASHLCNSFVL